MLRNSVELYKNYGRVPKAVKSLEILVEIYEKENPSIALSYCDQAVALSSEINQR